MSSVKLKELEAKLANYQKISSDAASLVSQISLMRSEITKASTAFQDVIVSGGQPYDNGELKKYNDNMLKASNNFNSLIEECNRQISALQANIDGEKEKLIKRQMKENARVVQQTAKIQETTYYKRMAKMELR